MILKRPKLNLDKMGFPHPGPDYHWIHPCHQRQLQSQNIERFAHLRKPLTDKKIEGYVKAGKLKYRPSYK